jgi:uncharacterized protein
MMSIELVTLLTVLESLHLSDATQATLVNKFIHNATTWSSRFWYAIYKYTLMEEGIFAYNTNGLGCQYMMDDANVISLLSWCLIWERENWGSFLTLTSHI